MKLNLSCCIFWGHGYETWAWRSCLITDHWTLPQTPWFCRFWVGPENLHFWPPSPPSPPQIMLICWFWDHSLRRTVLREHKNHFWIICPLCNNLYYFSIYTSTHDRYNWAQFSRAVTYFKNKQNPLLAKYRRVIGYRAIACCEQD